MFQPGQTVRIPCIIQPGPFPEENLITIQTDTGTLSGFVMSEFVTHIDGTAGYVTGTVTAVGDEVEIRLPGAFFETASGMATVSPDWASNNFQLAPA